MNPIGRRLLLSACIVTGLAGAAIQAAHAHHGGGVEWNRDVNGPVTGTVTEFAFRFPHVQIYMDVADADGDAESWVLVTRWTPTVLRNWGWTRNSVAPGDEVTATYATHVSEPNMGNMLELEVNGEPLPLSEPE